MCTLTWWSHPEGYDVFFNRDEQKSRLAALPPSVHEAKDGGRFVAAIDANAGGTWLFGNEHGLSVAILNFYEKEIPDDSTQHHRSRGLLVSGLGGCESMEAVAEALAGIDLAHYRAFTLLAFSDAPTFRVWRWVYDGETLEGPDREPTCPVCSSSFLSQEVVAEREVLLREMLSNHPDPVDGPQILREFHHYDQGGNPSTHTVKMNRPDAQTWSISHLTVGPERVRFSYEALPQDHIGLSECSEAEVTRRKKARE